MMTKRAARTAIALLAAVTLLAVHAGTGAASDDDNDKDSPTIEDCQAAWQASPAYPYCGDRSDAPGSTEETVELAGTLCRITTGCEYRYGGQLLRGSDSWEGNPAQTRTVQACRGGVLSLWC